MRDSAISRFYVTAFKFKNCCPKSPLPLFSKGVIPPCGIKGRERRIYPENLLDKMISLSIKNLLERKVHQEDVPSEALN